jgi:hypothetical protein
MSYDLEYFTEFLEDPSAPSLAEFYRMVTAWCHYLDEHKGEFNYLEDDEWEEIRERLLDEMDVREERKEQIEAEFEEIFVQVEDISVIGDEKAIELCKRRVQFMKDYQELYDFRDEDIAGMEEDLMNLEKSVRDAAILKDKLRAAEWELDESLAKIDDEMLKAYERTGKFPRIHWYQGLKQHKGN